jgi:hypothetical protein
MIAIILERRNFRLSAREHALRCAMRLSWSSILIPLSVLFFALSTLPSSALHQKRELRSDLEAELERPVCRQVVAGP